MTLGERLKEIVGLLPEGWSEARVVLTVADPAAADRAASILGSLAPGRSGSTFRLALSPAGLGAPSVEATLLVLDRLERERIDARLAVPDTPAYSLPSSPAAPPPRALAASWDEVVASFPPDWSDAYLELELASTDDLDAAALALAPVNPLLHRSAPPALRFRAAAHYGYGVAPQMARRALARLDEAGIPGQLRAVSVLSDTAPVATQGPVWRDGGRAV